MADAFRQIAPDRPQIREGGGRVALFGLPFFAAGILVCLSAVGAMPMSNANELSGAGLPALLLLGLAFTAVGAVFVFGRAWTTIDGTRRLVTKEWGLLWPMYARPSNLDGYTAVTIGHESGDSETAEQFPIFLRAGDKPGVRLCSFRQYATSRSCAAAVAGLLLLYFEDASSDHAERISASQAELSLQERARLERRRNEDVAPPAVVRSTVSDDSGTTRIVMPMPIAHPLVFVMTLLPAAITLIVVPPLGRFFRQTRTPEPIEWVFLGLLLLGFCVLPSLAALNTWLRSRFGRTISPSRPAACSSSCAASGATRRGQRSPLPRSSTWTGNA